MKTLLVLIGAAVVVGMLPVFDCHIVPPGNTYAGQTHCKTLLGKWLGSF